MRTVLRALTVVFFTAASVRSVQADPILANLSSGIPNNGSFTVEYGGINVWPFSSGGGNLFALDSDRRLFLAIFSEMDLGENLFCAACEPAQTNTSNRFSITLPNHVNNSNFVAVGGGTTGAQYFPAFYDITFAGEFRTTSPLLLDGPLGDTWPVILTSTISAIERATGNPVFSYELSGIGVAGAIQTEFQGELARGIGYGFTPIPEPTTLFLLGSGLALLAARHRLRP